jgi:uncharacterized membrane protein
MSSSIILHTILLALLPISELRGALPYAYFNHIPLFSAYVISVAANAVVAPVVFLFLTTVHKLFYHIKFYRILFDKTVSRARRKLEGKVKKFGYFGVMLFVAIPFPITGAYTGTLGAWILGLNWKKSSLAALGGVIISGCIVSMIILLGVGTSSIFLKRI